MLLSPWSVPMVLATRSSAVAFRSKLGLARQSIFLFQKFSHPCLEVRLSREISVEPSSMSCGHLSGDSTDGSEPSYNVWSSNIRNFFILVELIRFLGTEIPCCVYYPPRYRGLCDVGR